MAMARYSSSTTNDNRRFCEEEMSVDRFPTIRAFANGGDMEAYENNLDSASPLAYVKRVMGAAPRCRVGLARPGGGEYPLPQRRAQVLGATAA